MTTNPDTLRRGSEVTIMLSGRVVFAANGRLAVEYVQPSGFVDRVVVSSAAPAVTIMPGMPPGAVELARRQHAARMAAVSCRDPEARPRVMAEFVARWNDAYPAGTQVLVQQAGGDLEPGATSSPARLTAAGRAMVDVLGEPDPLPLHRVLPAADYAEGVADHG